MSTSSCTAFVPPRVLMVTGACLPEAERRLIDGKFADVIEVVSPRDPEDIFARGQCYRLRSRWTGVHRCWLLARMPALRRIALLGTGIPSFIDEAATRKRSIAVFNTPHVNADSVAEFALGIIIVNAADVVASADGVRTGSCWLQTPWRKLQDRRIGIVAGHIGQALIGRLVALGAREIVYASRTRKPALEREYGVRSISVRAMVAECDVVSIHVGYSQETHHMFDATMFAACRPDLRLHCFSNPEPLIRKRHAARWKRGMWAISIWMGTIGNGRTTSERTG